MNLILKWLMTALGIFLASLIVPGIVVNGLWTALWLALFFGLLNVSIRPLLLVLTLPINLLTFGVFTFIINALMIELAAAVIKGFYVNGFWAALLFSLVLSLFSYLMNRLSKKKDL